MRPEPTSLPERALALAFLEEHPHEAALALDRLPAAQAAALLRAAPAPHAAAAVREMTPRHACESLSALGPAAAAAIVGELPSTEAANLLRRMPPAAGDPLVAALPVRQREPVARALRYPEGTAGALMDPAIFELPEDVTVAEARDRLREAARDLLYYVYVVDREHRLVGVLDIPELMVARARDELRVVMHSRVDSLLAWEPVAAVRAHPGWRRYHAMPVVDEERRLLGAIRYQTFRRLEQDAVGAGPQPAALTALALGELYHLGLAGLVEGFTAPARGNAWRGDPPGADGPPEVRRG
jgi:magnesium transporter